MKELLRLNFTLLTLTFIGLLGQKVNAQSDYITTVESTPNLLGYWRFSSASQANSEVNGYTGTFMGNAMVGPPNSGPTLAVDPANSAAIFNDSGDFVNTSLTGQIDQEGTIVAWFYATALPVFPFANHIAGEFETDNHFDLVLSGEGEGKVFFFASTDVQGSATFHGPVQLNTWYLAVGTFNVAQNRTSVLVAREGDTNFASGGTNCQSHHLNSVPFQVGWVSPDVGYVPFQGRIDEVAVFNRELSLEELTAILNSTSVPGNSLSLTGAVSRKTHNGGGDFDLPLVLAPSTDATVEPRTGGPTEVIFTFSSNIVASDGMISSNEFAITNATFSSASISSNELTLNLTNVIDQSVVTIAINGIEDTAGNGLNGDNDIAIRALFADVNQDKVVDRSDFTLVAQHQRESVDSNNFLLDLDLDGLIRRVDGYLVKQNRHHTVP
jgi:hypothetical protein